MIDLESVRVQVRDVLVKNPDRAIFTDDQINDLIVKALKKYSRRRPQTTVSALTGNTTAIYSLPAAFENGFSRIKEVEFPIQLSPKQFIRANHYELDNDPDGKIFRFDNFNPGSGQTFWIKYTTRHEFGSDGQADVAESDQAAFEYLTASILCNAYSAFYASKANASLPEVEAIAYNERVDEYKTKAGDYFKMYTDEIIDEFTGIHGDVNFSRDMFWDRDSE